MADIAGKQFRAAQLREQLAVLRVQHSADLSEASAKAHEAELDTEIADLERQLAVEQIKAETGGSVIDAMEVMARAAEAEKKADVEAVKSAEPKANDESTESEAVSAPVEPVVVDPVVVVETITETPKTETVQGLDLRGGNQ